MEVLLLLCNPLKDLLLMLRIQKRCSLQQVGDGDLRQVLSLVLR